MHHAYLLIGSKFGSESVLDRFLAEAGFVKSGNPDYFAFRTESLGIPETRSIIELAARRPFGERKVIYIESDRLTHEAQNALLKVVEEPPGQTHFFITALEEGAILPTLRSRMQVVRMRERKVSSPAHGQRGKFATDNTFLSLPIKDRIEFAQNFEGNLPELLDNLALSLRDDLERLKHIFTLRRYAGDRSASARLILTHLALVL